MFVLVVANAGPKLHKAEPATDEEALSIVPAWAQNPSASSDKNGKLQIPPGHPGVLRALVGGNFRLMGRMQSSEDIAKAIQPEAGRRVIDKTASRDFMTTRSTIPPSHGPLGQRCEQTGRLGVHQRSGALISLGWR